MTGREGDLAVGSNLVPPRPTPQRVAGRFSAAGRLAVPDRAELTAAAAWDLADSLNAAADELDPAHRLTATEHRPVILLGDEPTCFWCWAPKAAEAIAELIMMHYRIPHPRSSFGDRHAGVRHRVDDRLPVWRLLGDVIEKISGA